MNELRAVLLVLLVLALPMRGVMAMANLCPPSAGATGEARTSPVSAGHVHADADAQHAVESGRAVAPHHHDKAAATDTCSLCSACCSVPPVPSTAPALPLLRDLAATAFPAYAVPAPSFLSDGQERPPRSI